MLAEDGVIDLDKNSIKNYNGPYHEYKFPAGSYRLTGDIQLSDYNGLLCLYFEGDTTLDLNGHILSASVSPTALFQINVGASGMDSHLTLTDSRPDAKHNTPITVDGQEINGGMIYGLQGKNVYDNECFKVHKGATLTMQGGSIVLGTSQKVWDFGADDPAAGGVFVAGTFNMTGGRIIGCSSGVCGGGVAVFKGGVFKGGVFNMAGGSIENCHAADDGGGVYVRGTFNMTGGTIKNCTADGNGGGVYVNTNGTFDMTGGTITGCTAVEGGGVYVDGDGKATLLPGSIDGKITGKYEEHEPPVEPEDPDYPLAPILPAIKKGMDFADVSAADWFCDDVKYVYESGLMTGTSDTAFSPDAPVTRGMVLTILARQDGIRTERYEPWYAAGCEWAVLHGVSDGTNPEAPVTREQLAAMLYRFAKLKGYDLTGGTLDAFADGAAASAYAREALGWAAAQTILTGANGRLDPQGAATRAQLAAILHRFLTK